MNQFYAKDFIETAEGLIFAVVQNGVEQGKVLCFLRYVFENNQWKKVDTAQANQLLQKSYPDYFYYSTVLDTSLHAVNVEKIFKHHQPKQRLQALLHQPPSDEVSADLLALCQLFQHAGIDLNSFGVTGSLLIGTQKASSDIDLVIYDRETFQQARRVTKSLINSNKLSALTQQDWQEAFKRRDCELNFAAYVWHEQRKYNKGMIHQRKFDLGLLQELQEISKPYSKLGATTLTVQISDDYYGFDYPARFLLSHPEIKQILCFTATYNGQAQTGEWVEVAGQLEISTDGDKHIVVGSTREARGEYIKVLSFVKKLSNFSAIIFDLDGLVLDTETTYIKAWQQAAQVMGYDFSILSMQALSGLHYQSIVKILLTNFGADFNLEQFNRLSGECWRDYVQHQGIEKKSGFDELLTVIKQREIPFCLATNSPEMNARECLALAGLAQTFSVIISRDDVKQGKPAPEIFLTAARRLQHRIEQCLVLEDSLVGIQAAQAAGAIPVLIPSILSLAESTLLQNVTVFADLTQVAEIVRNKSL